MRRMTSYVGTSIRTALKQKTSKSTVNVGHCKRPYESSNMCLGRRRKYSMGIIQNCLENV
jgi:hypothetical protein